MTFIQFAINNIKKSRKMNKIKSIISVFVLALLVFNSCDEFNGNAYEQKHQAIQKCI